MRNPLGIGEGDGTGSGGWYDYSIGEEKGKRELWNSAELRIREG
jgi:hypothetical protein